MHEALIKQLRAKLNILKKENPTQYHALERRIKEMVRTPDADNRASGVDAHHGRFSKERFERLVARLKKRPDVRNPVALARAIEEGRVHR